jgi:glutathione peroxidase-family protein
MKRLLAICMLATLLASASAQEIYNYTVKDDLGKDVSLADFKGKVLLIVNTATRCGFTPQYKELEALYEKYRAEGLEILDFPCNQFGQQAPGSIEEIHQFCTANFAIQFPQFDKIDVNGANESPLFTYLKARKGFSGFDTTDQTGKFMDNMLRKQDADYDKKSDIKWNFTKFLVSRDGRVVKRYEPTEKISNIEADICMELNPVLSTIMARRSVRKYMDKPVEHKKLETVALAGINAPSARNWQNWAVRIIEDQKLMADVKDMCRNAPNLICVCAPADGRFDLDAGLLGENMMLAAQSLGLGTCIQTGPVSFLTTDEKAKAFRDSLDIPADYKLLFIIAIGYPDEQPDARPRDASKVKFIK